MTPERLELSMERLGLNQTDLALFLGVSARGVRYWIAGEREIPASVETLLRLMEAIPLNADQVLNIIEHHGD